MAMKNRRQKRTISRKNTRKLQAFYKVSAVIVIAFGIVAVAAVMNSKLLHYSIVGAQSEQSGASSAVGKTDISSAPSSSQVSSQQAPSENSSVVSAPQPTPSPKPTPPKENTVQDPVQGQVPESKEVADAYFDNAVFIGDSRTEGLMMYAGPENAEYLTAKGLNVESAMEKPVINKGGNKVSVIDALGYGTYGKVYVMLGVNELGWAYSELFIKRYGELIDAIRQAQPNAEIYVQSILPVSREKSESDNIYNNANIKKYNDLIVKMTKEKGVHFLNVKEGIEDAEQCLPQEASTDGVHLNAQYCEKWMDYLRNHTV